MKLYANIILTVAVLIQILPRTTPVQLNDHQREIMQNYYKECAVQENLTDEEVMKFQSKDYADPTDNLKCFAACCFEKLGILKDDAIHMDVARRLLKGLMKEEEIDVVEEQCSGLSGEDRCDVAYKSFDCFQNVEMELRGE